MPKEDPSATAVIGGDPKGIAEAQAKASAAEDAWLDKNLGVEDDDAFSIPSDSQDGDNAPTDGRTRDDKGRFKTQESEPAKGSKEASEPVNPEGVNPDDYKKALRALELDGVPQASIDNMDPNEVMKWGLKRAENHRDVDQKSMRVAELEKQLKDLQAVTSQPKTATEAKPALETKDMVPAEMVELYGEDIREPMAKFADTIIGEFTKKMDASGTKFDELQTRIVGQDRITSRTELSKQWDLPDEKWQTVVAYREADRNDYQSEQEALTVACKVVLTDGDYAKRTRESANQDKDNGSTTTEQRRSFTPAATRDEMMTQVAELIHAGRHKDAQRIADVMNKQVDTESPEYLSRRIGVSSPK